MRALTPLSALVLLAACAGTGPDGQPAPVTSEVTYGEAVRHNMAAQIVDPEPADLTLPPADGNRTLLMLRRYQVDKVKPPQETSINTIGIGQSGGAAGGGTGMAQ
jgi:hypothetical protein